MARKLKILFLAAEAAPFVKVGGLGDVAGALPPAIRSLPEKPDIRVAIPMHSEIDLTKFPRKQTAAFEVWHSHGPITAEVFETKHQGVTVYLVSGAPIRQASHVYTSDTRADGHKYTFFSLAALELCRMIGWQPEILHAQDWHTAAAIYAVKTNLKDDPFFNKVRTLLTVHNLPYLGNGAGPALFEFGLAPAIGSALPWWAQDMPLPLGLLTSDRINTVSNGYAQEITTEAFGSGLHEFLVTRSQDLTGILNGLETDAWDPQTDPAIESNFSVKTLAKRKPNKLALLKELGLRGDPALPLLAFIGRMDYQKGIEIAFNALHQIAQLDWQAVILGTGDPDIEDQARRLAAEFPKRAASIIRFDSGLARRIYAGSDIMMIPSRYEPCGLIQMIAMRYGSVPVARATGGLRDTIHDYPTDPAGTGFLFETTSGEAMAEALRRALEAYADRRRWPYLQQRGMKQDFSWTNSAVQYLDVYRSLLDRGHKENTDA
jgi:starch synthase